MMSHTRRALVVVDVQNDFTENGALAVTGGDEVAVRIAAHAAAHRDAYDLIVTTQDMHHDPGDHFSADPDFVDSWPAHCVVGTPGAALDPLLGEGFAGLVDAAVFKGQYAAAYSGFEGTTDPTGVAGQSLDAVLAEAGITDVDVVGIATDYCVKATALDAARAGYDTTVLLDLCAAVAEANLPGTLAQLTEAGIAVADYATTRD